MPTHYPPGDPRHRPQQRTLGATPQPTRVTGPGLLPTSSTGTLPASPQRAPGGATLPPSPSPLPPSARTTGIPTSAPPPRAPSGPSDPAFWVTLPNGDRVPFDHPLAQTPGATQPPGVGEPPPPSPFETGTSTRIGGAGGSADLTTTALGETTGTAPEIPLGRTVDNELDALMRQRITDLLGQDLTNISVEDPDLAPAARAFSAARQREQARQATADMERLGAAGLASSGAANAAARQRAEAAGQDIAGFEANLVLNRMQERLETTRQMAGLAAQMGLAEESANLQRQLAGQAAQMQLFQLASTAQGREAQLAMATLNSEDRRFLAELDADLRRQGFSLAERLQRMDNEIRRYGIDVSGNLGLLNVMTDMLQLEQQNTQFYDALGFDMARFAFNQNNLLPAILGGF